MPDLATDDSNSNQIDALVRTANDALQANRACVSGCGNDLKCREALLLGTAARPYLAAHPGMRRTLVQEISKEAQSTWPKDGFSYPSDVLPNRDPSQFPDHHGSITQLRISDLQKFEASFKRTAGNTDYERLEKYRIESEYKNNIDFTYNHDESQIFDSGLDGLQETTVPYDDVTSRGDPTVKRPKVGAIPSSLAGEFLLDHVTDCFNLSNTDETF